MSPADHQRLRLRRFGLSLVTYAIWIGFLLYGHALGYYDFELGGLEFPVQWLIAAMVASNTLFLVLFVSGANLRFADPSLTLPMMVTALTWAICTAGAIPEHRAFSFTAFIVIFVFGIFNLRARQYAACLLYSMAGYVLIAYATLPPQADSERLNLELMQGLLLAAMLFWIAFFGNYVGRLRSKLSERNAELKQALALVKELAVRDDLTGVHNRRYVMDALARERRRSARHGTTFSVIVLDLDRFKAVNDTYGHPAGDAVLKAFVDRLNAVVRGVDVVGTVEDTLGRFGGEEFILVLPDTGSDGARLVGERIRASIGGTPFRTEAGDIPLTVSAGIAEYQPRESVRDLLERVDRALYAAKHAGRDRIAKAPLERDGTPMVLPPG